MGVPDYDCTAGEETSDLPIQDDSQNNSCNSLSSEDNQSKQSKINTECGEIISREDIDYSWEKFTPISMMFLDHFQPVSSILQPPYLWDEDIKRIFKLCLVFPHDSDPEFKEWLYYKFDLDPIQDNFENISACKKLQAGDCCVIIRAVQMGSGQESDYAACLKGASAVMLFIPLLYKEKSFKDDFTYLCKCALKNASIPIFMCYIGNTSSDDTISYMDDLESCIINLKSHGYFNHYNDIIIQEPSDLHEFSRAILKGLKWLDENKKSLIPLKKVSFREFISDAVKITFHFLFAQANSLKEPQHIINIFNECVKAYAGIIYENVLINIHSSWPPEEIKDKFDTEFIDLHKQKKCQEIMKKVFILPDFKGISSCEIDVYNYGSTIEGFNMFLWETLRSPNNSWLKKLNSCVDHLFETFNFNVKDVDIFYAESSLSKVNATIPKLIDLLLKYIRDGNPEELNRDLYEKKMRSCIDELFNEYEELLPASAH